MLEWGRLPFINSNEELVSLGALLSMSLDGRWKPPVLNSLTRTGEAQGYGSGRLAKPDHQNSLDGIQSTRLQSLTSFVPDVSQRLKLPLRRCSEMLQPYC